VEQPARVGLIGRGQIEANFARRAKVRLYHERGS
jgi:lactate dehydrogenase-like 2-hydroxyacid dehydrogenase